MQAFHRLGMIAGAVVLVMLLGACSTLSGEDLSSDRDETPARVIAAPAAPQDASVRDASGAVAVLERAPRSAGLPQGWEPWILSPAKKKTRYDTRGQNGETVITAHAESSASGLARRMNIDPAALPWIEWRWRVDALIPGADNTDRYAEDSPVRVVLAFDGDRRKLPVRDQLFFEQAKLLSGGRDIPYATLMYIWENRQPVGTVLTNPHTSRVRKIVVGSGEDGLGHWQTYRRNIVEDYRRAYGYEPGRLIGIAILTDTDNTRQSVSARYGKIRLLER